jgi:transposase-like protein
LPESINTVWEKTLVQSCVIHLLRNTFRYAARQDWDSIARDLRPIYTAVNEPMARERFHEFGDKWRGKYPAAVALWGRAWSELVTFLDYDVEIRKIIATTNAVESLNARYRRAVRARGHFPNDQAALKCLYLVTRSLDPTGRGKHDGSSGGRPHSTPSPSPSKGASAPR